MSVVEHPKRHRERQLEHRLAVKEVYEDRGYVFANDIGGYCTPKRFIAASPV